MRTIMLQERETEGKIRRSVFHGGGAGNSMAGPCWWLLAPTYLLKIMLQASVSPTTQTPLSVPSP